MRKHFRGVQDRRMGERLYRGRAHKCREVQVDAAKFIAVIFEAGPEEGTGWSGAVLTLAVVVSAAALAASFAQRESRPTRAQAGLSHEY